MDIISLNTYLPFGRPNFTAEESQSIIDVLATGWIGYGDEVHKFESELASFVGIPNVVCVSSCTSALFLSLLVHNIRAGDEVIVPSLTWCATANVAIYLGATPVFVDIDPTSLCADTDALLAAVTPRTKAAIVVHYGGHAVDVQTLRTRLPSHVALIEDAAHAFGAKYPNGAMVGSSGNLVCFSFYANKNLSTGDGGAICTNDGDLAHRLRVLSNNGLDSTAWERYSKPRAIASPDISLLGYKMNYTNLLAALGRVQLRRFAELQARRRTIADHYLAKLDNLTHMVFGQPSLSSTDHALHLFPIRVLLNDPTPQRDALLAHFRAHNIGASVHYRPLHIQSYYTQFYSRHLAHTDVVWPQLLTLPISSSMSIDEANTVCECLLAFFRGSRKGV